MLHILCIVDECIYKSQKVMMDSVSFMITLQTRPTEIKYLAVLLTP